MQWLWVGAGLVVVVGTLADAFDTLLATGIEGSRFSPTAVFYTRTWKPWRHLGGRITSSRRRERWMALYGPLSIIGLLCMWTAGQILGWSLVWWGLRGHFVTPVHSFGAALYYSGVVYFSIGFGDILAGGGFARVLTVVEAFGGLGTLGLVIGFLPSLNAAYQAREQQLLLLDDLGDVRITPATLVRSYLRTPGDRSDLDAMFDGWTVWCAEVFESHSSFPMLVLFRSKYRGHSWVTALGVVTDAAIASLAITPGSGRDPSMRLYRQSCRLVRSLAERLGLEPVPYEPLGARWWSIAYSGLQAQGFETRSFEDSYQRLNELRREFHPYMEAFIDALLAPRGFWGVTSAEHMAQAEIGAFLLDEDD